MSNDGELSENKISKYLELPVEVVKELADKLQPVKRITVYEQIKKAGTLETEISCFYYIDFLPIGTIQLKKQQQIPIYIFFTKYVSLT